MLIKIFKVLILFLVILAIVLFFWLNIGLKIEEANSNLKFSHPKFYLNNQPISPPEKERP